MWKKIYLVRSIQQKHMHNQAPNRRRLRPGAHLPALQQSASSAAHQHRPAKQGRRFQEKVSRGSIVGPQTLKCLVTGDPERRVLPFYPEKLPIGATSNGGGVLSGVEGSMSCRALRSPGLEMLFRIIWSRNLGTSQLNDSMESRSVQIKVRILKIMILCQDFFGGLRIPCLLTCPGSTWIQKKLS